MEIHTILYKIEKTGPRNNLPELSPVKPPANYPPDMYHLPKEPRDQQIHPPKVRVTKSKDLVKQSGLAQRNIDRGPERTPPSKIKKSNNNGEGEQIQPNSKDLVKQSGLAQRNIDRGPERAPPSKNNKKSNKSNNKKSNNKSKNNKKSNNNGECEQIQPAQGGQAYTQTRDVLRQS